MQLIVIKCCYQSMSKNVVKNKQYLFLLLNTTKDQAAALINTATPEQIALLSEIAYNILRLPLEKAAASLVKRNKTLFEQLATEKVTNSKKKLLLSKHYKPFLMTLWALKPQLMQLQ